MESKGGRAYAVILVGGKGKRLRPLSTSSRPKAFLSVTGDDKTMFRRTVERISNIIPPKNTIVVASRKHAALVRKNFPQIRKENLLLEPVSKNTAPAIALAASTIERRDKGAVMAVLPTDQYIIDEEEYLISVRAAISFARSNKEAIVVMGVEPTYPATGFGYVKTGSRVEGRRSGAPDAAPVDIYKVEKFTEKPDLDTAEKFVREGYLWNTGAFVFAAGTILENMKAFAPKIYRVFARSEGSVPAGRYRLLPDISVDYAVMEKAKDIYCTRGRYRWRDMGNFESLKEILMMESRRFVEKGGKITRII